MTSRARRACKQVLQRQLGLAVRSDVLTLGVVSRLTAQKGLDLLLALLPWLVQRPLQLAVLGSGEPALEAAFTAAAAAHPGQVAVRLGYDENFAHGMIAGVDRHAGAVAFRAVRSDAAATPCATARCRSFAASAVWPTRSSMPTNMRSRPGLPPASTSSRPRHGPCNVPSSMRSTFSACPRPGVR